MGLEKLSSLLCKGLMVTGGASLCLLVLLATGNVAFRIFDVPYAGTYEIVSFLGALVIAGALGYTQRKKDHIVVDIISAKFPPLLKRVLDVLNYLLTTILFSVAAWQVAVWAGKIRSSGELSETLKIPFHPFVYGVAVGFGVLAFTLFLDLMRTLLKGGEQQ